MTEQEQHEMILEEAHSSGAEEWYCPTCGRRLLIDWQPKFKKKVIESGDGYAIHSGGKGGLQMGRMNIKTTPQDQPETLIESKWLAPWVAWLDKVDFYSLWNSKG